jgi:hypothetical protein
MLKKMIAVGAAVMVAAALAGCSSIDTGTSLNGEKLTLPESTNVAHLNGYAWGIYFFGLPLFAGSTSHPGTCAIFKDTIQVDNICSMITKKSKDLGATKLTDLSTRRSGSWFILFSYKEIEASGNAVK